MIFIDPRWLLDDLSPFNRPKYTEKDYPDLTGKVYIVTGASSGIGFQASRLLLHQNATVYLVGRTESKLINAADCLRREFPNAKLDTLLVDYADLATIKPQVQKFLDSNDRLDGVIHNAGMNFAHNGAKTVQGHELTLGTNGIAPQLLQTLLDDILIKTAEKSPPNSVRLVWVSSSAHNLSQFNGGMNWGNYNEVRDGLLGWGKYAQSKTANIYQAIVWPKKHSNSGVVCVHVHPGLIETDIGRTLNSVQKRVGGLFCYPAIYGAYSVLYPFLSIDVTTDDNGDYYVPFGKKTNARSDIVEAAQGERGEELWNWLQEQIAPFV
jgi:retinol dehydrogenase-12